MLVQAAALCEWAEIIHADFDSFLSFFSFFLLEIHGDRFSEGQTENNLSLPFIASSVYHQAASKMNFSNLWPRAGKPRKHVH